MPKSKIRRKAGQRKGSEQYTLPGPPWETYLRAEVQYGAAREPLLMLAHWPCRLLMDGADPSTAREFSIAASADGQSFHEAAEACQRLADDGFLGWDQKNQTVLMFIPETALEGSQDGEDIDSTP